MKRLFVSWLFATLFFFGSSQEKVFHGSTPADLHVRQFLGISSVDSIDFIIWTLKLNGNQFDVDCRYGISKPSTPRFQNEKKAAFAGNLSRQGNYYTLTQGKRHLHLQDINENLLQVLDANKKMLIGNGGYSFTLNVDKPVVTGEFNPKILQQPFSPTMVFQGRTPCQELAKMMGLNKSDACNKMKWYIIFYSDPATKKPTYYLKGGRAYKKETMDRGKWEIKQGSNGSMIIRLDPDKPHGAYLVRADENILYFTDPSGKLLVGNEYFSYTLNRTHER